MTIPRDEFRRFSDSRNRMNDQLDALRRQIDEWLAVNEDVEQTMAGLARLSGLIEMRRDLLEELARLDDDFLAMLITERGTDGKID